MRTFIVPDGRRYAAACVIFYSFGVGPAFGQASRVISPFAQAEAGNVDTTYVMPAISLGYDSNLIQANDLRFSGKRDDVRVTPGLRAGIHKLVGRIAFSGAVNAGYDIHSRFKSLNQLRLSASGSVETPVGAICKIKPSAEGQIYQTDLSESAAIGKNTTQVQDYSVTLGCYPSIGLAPVASVSFDRATNSFRSAFNLNTVDYRFSLGYSRPSLGTLSAYADYLVLDRTGIQSVTGVADNTTSAQVGLSLRRAVSPRIKITLNAGYLFAKPDRIGVRNFSGPAFSGSIVLAPKPSLTLTLSAERSIQGQSSYDVTYIIREDYSAAVDWKLTARGSMRLSGLRVYRRLRGEQAIGAEPLRIRDQTTLIDLAYLFALQKALQMGIHVGYRWRDDPTRYYNYRGTTLTASVGTRF